MPKVGYLGNKKSRLRLVVIINSVGIMIGFIIYVVVCQLVVFVIGYLYFRSGEYKRELEEYEKDLEDNNK